MAKDWKEVFLRSGVPLEYEVARILADRGFGLHADFPYFRQDGAERKEHSIDLLAFWFGEGKDRRYRFEVHIMVECKYRSRGKILLLLPDPDTNVSLGTLGATVVSYDEFVPFYLKGNCFVELEQCYPFVYKGIELHDGEAVERDFRRGIEQLRYSTPVAMLQAFEFGLSGHPLDAHAMFFAKIMVTNASIHLLNGDAEIASATVIEQVSEPVDGAILISDYGPDYERHFRRVFDKEKKWLLDQGKALQKYIEKEGKKLSFLEGPRSFIKSVISAERSNCLGASSQFFISSVDHLPNLVDGILRHTKEAYRGRTTNERKYKRDRIP